MKKALSLLLALVLVLSLVACSKGGDKKTLKGSAKGYSGENLEVTVTKEGDKITKVDVAANKETPNIGGEAIKKLTKSITEKGTTEGVEAISGATITSEALLKAVKEAK